MSFSLDDWIEFDYKKELGDYLSRVWYEQENPTRNTQAHLQSEPCGMDNA